MLMGILGHIADYDEVRSIVQRLLAGPAVGQLLRAQRRHQRRQQGVRAGLGGLQPERRGPYILRSPQQLAGFFDGLELVEPGVVSCPRWRPDPADAAGGLPAEVNAFGGVGRKP